MPSFFFEYLEVVSSTSDTILCCLGSATLSSFSNRSKPAAVSAIAELRTIYTAKLKERDSLTLIIICTIFLRIKTSKLIHRVEGCRFLQNLRGMNECEPQGASVEAKASPSMTLSENSSSLCRGSPNNSKQIDLKEWQSAQLNAGMVLMNEQCASNRNIFFRGCFDAVQETSGQVNGFLCAVTMRAVLFLFGVLGTSSADVFDDELYRAALQPALCARQLAGMRRADCNADDLFDDELYRAALPPALCARQLAGMRRADCNADDLFDDELYRAALQPALCARQLAGMRRADCKCLLSYISALTTFRRRAVPSSAAAGAERAADDLFDDELYRAALQPALCARQLAGMRRADCNADDLFDDELYRAALQPALSARQLAGMRADCNADDLFDDELYRAALQPALCARQLAGMRRADFYDASFREPEGLLGGNLYSLGNYHQCLAINQDFPGNNIQGKYCMIRAPLTPPTLIHRVEGCRFLQNLRGMNECEPQGASVEAKASPSMTLSENSSSLCRGSPNNSCLITIYRALNDADVTGLLNGSSDDSSEDEQDVLLPPNKEMSSSSSSDAAEASSSSKEDKAPLSSLR
ncbi:hypothetical protein MSG28_004705 [Choristoneura fumiferana]|uniref:Uncharacterized protein n=1 Tax=Choristoneura fumiferana TaxID=7141 RepID=A0ACC0K782_CHOFU|nr:hypothetical protein MSG28_004705 [Choristoneura fumiferana]